MFARVDNRPRAALRPVSIQLNPLKAGPSCKIVVGNIKNEDGILTGIGGRTSIFSILLPSGETKSRNAVGSFHRPYMEAFIRPASGREPGKRSSGTIKSAIRRMEAVLVKAMQRLVDPGELGKVTLSLRIQVVEDSGGLLAACLNSLVLCLSLSGIKMRSVPYAVSLGVVGTQPLDRGPECVILDPTDHEIKTYCSTSLTVLCDPETGDLDVVAVDSGSGFYGDALGLIKSLARRAASSCRDQVEAVKREALSGYYVSVEANK